MTWSTFLKKMCWVCFQGLESQKYRFYLRFMSNIMTSDYEFRDYETIKVTRSYFRNGRGWRGVQTTWVKGRLRVVSRCRGPYTGPALGIILVTASVLHSGPTTAHLSYTPWTGVLFGNEAKNANTLKCEVTTLKTLVFTERSLCAGPERENDQVQTAALPSWKYDVLPRIVTSSSWRPLLQHAGSHMQTEPCSRHSAALTLVPLPCY